MFVKSFLRELLQNRPKFLWRELWSAKIPSSRTVFLGTIVSTIKRNEVNNLFLSFLYYDCIDVIMYAKTVSQETA